jgi:tetratricopeptide (TPR) repeat protein
MKRFALGCCLLLAGLCGAEEKVAWSARETRLANEYLGLLVAQPEEGRVLDLLWQLYASHGETELLIANIAAQAVARPHPSVTLVRAHLLKKKGDLEAAAGLYAEVLKAVPGNRYALRAAARTAAERERRGEAIGFYEALAGVLEAGSGERLAVWLEAGDLALGGGEVERAAGFWEKAAGEQPGSLEVARQVAQRLLQAGLSGRAAVFFKALAEKAEPQEKLNALGDLARILAHADQFEEADAALRSGLGMLHFRDARHAAFFLQRVRLHERFGRLEELRVSLEKAVAEAKVGGREAMLHELAAFYALTVNPEERLRVLRLLVEAVPGEEGYRWEWVRAVLDQGEVEEAKGWLDGRLAELGARAPVAWVLLRCEADLRAGDPEAAVGRLNGVLDAGGAAVEKEVLSFAQQRALDAVVERVLRERVRREPGRTEAVFELATHLRGRQQGAEAQAVLDGYVGAAGKPEEYLESGKRSIVAGNGEKGIPVDGSVAANAPLVDPRAVAADRLGNVYILERGGNALRVVNSQGKIRTVVNTLGKKGISEHHGPAAEAKLNGPKHLCIDRQNRVIIADAENHIVVRYDPQGETVQRIAGTGLAGRQGTGGDPLQCQLARPHGVSIHPTTGELFITDSYNDRILRIEKSK